jgi:hypothetical protein
MSQISNQKGKDAVKVSGLLPPIVRDTGGAVFSQPKSKYVFKVKDIGNLRQLDEVDKNGRGH